MRFISALTFLSLSAMLLALPAAATNARVPVFAPTSRTALPLAPAQRAGGLAPQHASWMRPDSAGCIYLTDNVSGTVNVYRSNKPYTLIGTLASSNGYGWGVDDNHTTVYVGAANDTIDEFAPCTGTTVLKTLQGTGGGPPSSIAVTPTGGVYATEWPNGGVDYWSPLGTLSHYPAITAYGLAVDNKHHVYLSAFNSSQSQLVVLRCTSKFARCEQIISLSGGFAGGIQVDSMHNVYVDDQHGTLDSYACSSSACTQSGSFTYSNGTNPLDYTAIALDTKVTHIWGANIYYCSSSDGLCGDAQRQSLPLSSAVLDGNTPQWNNAEPMGVAVWRPDKA